MPASQDLMGLGMNAILAQLVGQDPQAVTAAGTTQATARAASGDVIEMTATGSDGIILPTGPICQPFFVINSSASTGLVYTPVGSTLNGLASTTGLSLTTKSRAILLSTS